MTCTTPFPASRSGRVMVALPTVSLPAKDMQRFVKPYQCRMHLLVATTIGSKDRRQDEPASADAFARQACLHPPRSSVLTVGANSHQRLAF